MIPPEVLGGPEPETPYIAEAAGSEVILHRETSSGTSGAESWESWLKDWDELSQQIGELWHSDKSAAEVVSEMRR